MFKSEFNIGPYDIVTLTYPNFITSTQKPTDFFEKEIAILIEKKPFEMETLLNKLNGKKLLYINSHGLVDPEGVYIAINSKELNPVENFFISEYNGVILSVCGDESNANIEFSHIPYPILHPRGIIPIYGTIQTFGDNFELSGENLKLSTDNNFPNLKQLIDGLEKFSPSNGRLYWRPNSEKYNHLRKKLEKIPN